MKYYVQIGSRTVEIEVEERGEDYIVGIEGRKVEADLTKVDGVSLFSLLLDGQSHEVFIDQGEHEYVVMVSGERYQVKVQDERAKRLSDVAHKAMSYEGELVIKAPMPGLVVSLDVKAGDSVKRGQGLLVLEAMKMENEMRSPRAGTVRAVYVEKGVRVEHGRDLIVIG